MNHKIKKNRVPRLNSSGEIVMGKPVSLRVSDEDFVLFYKLINMLGSKDLLSSQSV